MIHLCLSFILALSLVSIQAGQLHDALKKNDIPAAETLALKGMEINEKNAYSQTPLMLAAKMSAPNLVKILLDRGADVNAADGRGFNSLILASEIGHAEIVKLLIERGARINSPDTYGRTPLMYAVEANKPAVVKVLTEKGADVNLKDKKDRTALLLAAQVGASPDIIKALLDRRADATQVDSRGKGLLFHVNNPPDGFQMTPERAVIAEMLKNAGAKQ